MKKNIACLITSLHDAQSITLFICYIIYYEYIYAVQLN